MGTISDTQNNELPKIIGKGYGTFWHSQHRYRVVKGSRGSKKSTTTALNMIYRIMNKPLRNGLVVRNTFATHKDSTFALLKWAAQRLGVYDRWKFTKSPLEAIYMKTGQRILFRGFDDALKLTGITVPHGYLTDVWVEEAYQIENESDFDTLDESIRGELPDGYFHQFTITFNPWEQGHWLKKRFFDTPQDNVLSMTTNYKCNEWLSDEDRRKYESYKDTDYERYKVVALGEWGIPGGTYFNEWRSDIHVIDPFVIPDHWQRFRALDYGLDMLACYWIAIGEDGTIYAYKELNEPDLIISDAAKKIISLTLPSENIRTTYIPPDLFNRRQETGKSPAIIFAENGIRITKSSNSRVSGWLAVKEYLKPYETKDIITGDPVITANLKVFRNCHNLIRCLPQLQSDKHDPNDVATEPHDITHAPDAIRYFCVMRNRPSVEDDPKKQKLKQRMNQINPMITFNGRRN